MLHLQWYIFLIEYKLLLEEKICCLLHVRNDNTISVCQVRINVCKTPHQILKTKKTYIFFYF